MHVIAVAAPQARRSWVDAFARERYGSAPVTVYFDQSGKFFNSVRRSSVYPAHVFYSKAGKRIFSLKGYPFPATPLG